MSCSSWALSASSASCVLRITRLMVLSLGEGRLGERLRTKAMPWRETRGGLSMRGSHEASGNNLRAM